MEYPALPQEKRLAAARITGASARLGWGKDRDLDRAEAVDELHAISRDPEVLGHVLGSYIGVDAEPGYAAAAALLRAAGADEAAAARMAEWQAWRRRRTASAAGPTL